MFAATVACGIALLLMAAALRPSTPPSSEPEFPSRLPVVVPTQDARKPAASENRLYSAVEGTGTDGVAWVTSMLSESDKTPAAKARREEFRAELMKEPALKAKLEAFRKLPPEHREDAARFLASFSRAPEFRGLAARFGAGGQSGAQAVARDAGGGGSANPQPFGAGESRFASAGPSAATRVAAGGADGGASARGFNSSTRVSGLERKTGDATKTARSYQTAPGSDRVSAADAAQVQPSETAASAPGAVGPGAADSAPKLNVELDKKSINLKPDKAKILLKLYPCLANAGPEVVGRLAAADRFEKAGLWGACFDLRLYETCKDAGCASSGAGGCWAACLAANPGEERRCVGLVRSQPGCGKDDVDAAVWDQYCNRAAPAPECGTAGVDIRYRDCAGRGAECRGRYADGRAVSSQPGCDPPLLGAPLWTVVEGQLVMFFNSGAPPPALLDGQLSSSEVLRGYQRFAQLNPGVDCNLNNAPR